MTRVLAQTLGLPLAEVLKEHRESVTAVFIESGRCDLRLPAGVPLPPLAGGMPVTERKTPGEGELLRHVAEEGPLGKNVSAPANGYAIPTCIPADGDLPKARHNILAHRQFW